MMWRDWVFFALLVGMKNGAATMKNNVIFTQKIKHRVVI